LGHFWNRLDQNGCHFCSFRLILLFVVGMPLWGMKMEKNVLGYFCERASMVV